jgi:hypothetical protein
MVKRSSRGVASRLYSPIGQALRMASNVFGVATNTTRNIVQRSIRAVNNVGSSVTKRTNLAIRGLTRRRRSERKTRRASRR